MAKRKGTKGSKKTKSTKRKAAPKKRVAAAKRTARKATKRAKTRKAPKKTAARKAPARKTVAKKKARTVKKAARKAPRATARKAKPAQAKRAAKPTQPKRAAAPAAQAPRKVPALNRERRTVQDDDLVQTPPSSLNLDRTASAARSGRKGLAHRFAEHNETSPAITAGDVDADWEGAYASGDEAPGGDNPTPDQDIVDDIGKAVGIVYQDNEELKGADKVAKRDEHRWELDPASSEDYDDRD